MPMMIGYRVNSLRAVQTIFSSFEEHLKKEVRPGRISMIRDITYKEENKEGEFPYISHKSYYCPTWLANT